MTVKHTVLRSFTRLTGLELRRAASGTRHGGGSGGGSSRPTVEPFVPAVPVSTEELTRARQAAGDRLLEGPVFILSSVRSGSTLLRVILNSHSRLYSPHELHLREVKVNLANKYVKGAMAELGADHIELEYLLWDRILHRELTRNHKDVLVNKTPSDALVWPRLVECWPDARFIFLLRHPAAMVDSWNRARSYWSRAETTADILRYVSKVEEARQAVPGLTVRYEDITHDPEAQTRRICEFIGVDWEPAMLDYGDASHGDFRPGLGDWSQQIKSGKVQPARPAPAPEEIPAPLREIAASWGYLREGSPTH